MVRHDDSDLEAALPSMSLTLAHGWSRRSLVSTPITPGWGASAPNRLHRAGLGNDLEAGARTGKHRTWRAVRRLRPSQVHFSGRAAAAPMPNHQHEVGRSLIAGLEGSRSQLYGLPPRSDRHTLSRPAPDRLRGELTLPSSRSLSATGPTQRSRGSRAPVRIPRPDRWAYRHYRPLTDTGQAPFSTAELPRPAAKLVPYSSFGYGPSSGLRSW